MTTDRTNSEHPGNSGIPPHGGILIDRELTGRAYAEELQNSRALHPITLGERELADLEMIGVGAMSPLTGFMKEADYRSVLIDMHLENGLAWTMPITLRADAQVAGQLQAGRKIALTDGRDIVGTMLVEEIFTSDKEEEAHHVFGTTDPGHPGVAALYQQGDFLLGGPVWVLKRPGQERFPQYRFTPAQTRAYFQEKGWEKVTAFQTRNPIHRAHEYIQKSALETMDGLLLHPLVGATKADDIPSDVRMRSYQAILDAYYPKDRVLLAVFPAAMRYAGPREAVFHALCRKNYGCTHLIVGRDHAGVGNFYGTYDSQKIFRLFPPEEIGISPLCFEHAFYCRTCDAMATSKTCPHDAEHHITLSGTKVRAMLRQGELPPKEFSRPEVAQILADAMHRTASA